jgi:hypothetical protein
MSDEYPEVQHDQFLSYSLRKCAQQILIETNQIGFVPATAVGISHM